MKFIEKAIYNQMQYTVDNDDSCFTKKKAELYGITEKEQFVKIDEGYDILSILCEAYNLNGYIGIAVHTSGWGLHASLMNEISDNFPISKHEASRRIAIICGTTDGSVYSAMCYADDLSKIELAPDGQGEIPDYLHNCWTLNCPRARLSMS